MLISEITEGALLAGDSREYRLGPVLAEGGEGIVHFVTNRDDVVAKLYKEGEYGRETKLKGLIALSTKRLRRVAAWPLSCLFDSQDQPVGFIMESLEEWQPLHSVYQIRTRLRNSPHHTWAFLVRVARNVATCVHHVHEHGMVIGDLNESNILVGPDAMAKIIDTDSFQVRLEGKLYPCKVAKPELLAPELQGTSLEGTERTPDQDRFALAVLIFQTLMFGRHPFAGCPVGDQDVSLERAIANGWYVFTERRKIPVDPPPHLTLEGMSDTIKELFERAFDPAEPVRPSGREWFAALKELEVSLRTCSINASHVYGGGGKRCPWCGLEEKWNITLFRPAPIDPLSAADFDVEAVWNRISSLPAPAAERVPAPMSYNKLPPAPLTPWQKYAVRPLKLISLDYAFWFVYLAIIFGRATLDSGPIAQGLFVSLLILGGAVTLYVHEIRRRVRAANRQLATIAKEWEARADTKLYDDRVSVLLYERNSLRSNLDRYEAARQARIRELHQTDLDRFLRKYSIMAADAGPGTQGRGQLTNLRDRGIANAADIDKAALMKLRDFEPELSQRMLDWRSALEEQFWQATSYGLPPHEERALLERIYREDVGMRRDLLNADTELQQLAAGLRIQQAELQEKASPYEATVQRYGSLLAALETRAHREKS